mmetsp:Transcript_47766/g.76059  ORF Transcript_47766/g.76059 Transcript_47766/m.76059 type:complete len:277 (+) Transcript_47766:265-1095(+)
MRAVIDALLRRPGKQGPLWVELHPKDGPISAFNNRDKALALPILVGGQDLKDLLQLAVFLKLLRCNSIMVQVAGQVLLGDPSLQLRGEGGSQQPGARRRSSQAQRKRQVFGIVGVGLEHPPSTCPQHGKGLQAHTGTPQGHPVTGRQGQIEQHRCCVEVLLGFGIGLSGNIHPSSREKDTVHRTKGFLQLTVAPIIQEWHHTSTCRLNEFRVQRREAGHASAIASHGHSRLAASIRRNRQDPNDGCIRGTTLRQCSTAQSTAQKALNCATHGTGKV